MKLLQDFQTAKLKHRQVRRFFKVDDVLGLVAPKTDLQRIQQEALFVYATMGEAYLLLHESQPDGLGSADLPARQVVAKVAGPPHAQLTNTNLHNKLKLNTNL